MALSGADEHHFHTDFLAGHPELSHGTGAWIGYGQRAEAEYPVRRLIDGERISPGDVQLQILETPDHTPESIGILVHEHADELGRMLHDTIHDKPMVLRDAVRVFPAHGAGSACGKNLCTQSRCTIGEQRATNYTCRPMSEERFVALPTEGQPSAPAHFVLHRLVQHRPDGLLGVDDEDGTYGGGAGRVPVEHSVAARDAGVQVGDDRERDAYPELSSIARVQARRLWPESTELPSRPTSAGEADWSESAIGGSLAGDHGSGYPTRYFHDPSSSHAGRPRPLPAREQSGLARRFH